MISKLKKKDKIEELKKNRVHLMPKLIKWKLGMKLHSSTSPAVLFSGSVVVDSTIFYYILLFCDALITDFIF